MDIRLLFIIMSQRSNIHDDNNANPPRPPLYYFPYCMLLPALGY